MKPKTKIETLLIEIGENTNTPISKSEAIEINRKEYLSYSFNATLGGYCLVWVNVDSNKQSPLGKLNIRIKSDLFIKKLNKIILFGF